MFINLYFIGFLTLLFLIKDFYSKIKRVHPNEARGPIPFPLIGNAPQIGAKSPHLSLDKYVKKYNGIVRIWMCDYYTLFISDLPKIKELFENYHMEFNQRPMIPSIKLGCNNAKGLAGATGDNWDRNKNMVIKALRKSNTNTIYTELYKKSLDLVASMKEYEESGKIFYPQFYFRRFVLAAMFKYLFNEEIVDSVDGSVNEQVELFTVEMEQILGNLKVGEILDYFKVLGPLYYKYLIATDKTYSKIRQMVKDRYDAHLETIDRERPKDLLDYLIVEYGENHTPLDIVNINQVCVDIFIAGSDTTANTMEWILLELINNPEYQEVAYNELKRICGDSNSVNLKDRYNTPYINAIIKETLRVHTTIIFGLPRSNDHQDVMVGDLFVPKDSIIFINYHAIAFDENLFPNPTKFDPNRFLDKTPDAFIPFGLGGRQCPGRPLAMDQLYLCLANILFKFKLSSSNGKKINNEEQFGLTITPFKYGISLESR